MHAAKRGATTRPRHGRARPREETLMDRCKHNVLPKVGEVCPDDASVLALSVPRFIAAGYMTGDVACWDAAHDGAERVLGEAEAPPFVAAMTAVMRAIRAERATDWSFL